MQLARCDIVTSLARLERFRRPLRAGGREGIAPRPRPRGHSVTGAGEGGSGPFREDPRTRAARRSWTAPTTRLRARRRPFLLPVRVCGSLDAWIAAAKDFG